MPFVFINTLIIGLFRSKKRFCPNYYRGDGFIYRMISANKSASDTLISIKEIYLEPEVYNYERGKEILDKFPEAKRIEVPSHWKIPSLHGNEGSLDDWIKIKKTILVLGVKKSLSCRVNERSSNFVAPSTSNGCAMACSYCYVPRRKGYANPISLFVNIEQICNYLKRHSAKVGPKPIPDQIDPMYWVYEIGENGDCSVDASICNNVKDLILLFKELPNAKSTFATKFVNKEMLNYDPQRKTRIRFSLMPSSIAKVIDVRTSSMSERINAINDFVEAGYEVHVNFSPVVYYEQWQEDYKILFEELNDSLKDASRKQLKSEVIFLTHNTKLHEINMEWHPKGEELIWSPEIQEAKFSQTGGKNLRYKRGFKSQLVKEFSELHGKILPYSEIRYAF
jgi:spore photoproduct lyase